MLAPGQSPSIYREDAHVICKSKGVEQIPSEHEVAPGPEAAARAYAREYYAGESYGDCRQKAAYEGCLAGLTNP